MKSSNKGITLIALIITIIVLLILAGITIGALTSNNSVLKQAGRAKNEYEIANEKEIVKIATAQAIGNNKEGIIEQTELENILKQNEPNRNIKVHTDEDGYAVEFKDTKRVYKVDDIGIISEYDDWPTITEKPNVSQTKTTLDRSWGMVDIVFLNGTSYKISEVPNAPKLDNTMIPVYYDETEESWIVCNSDNQNWYNYEAQIGNTDGKTSKWANVMLLDDIVVEKDNTEYNTNTIKTLVAEDNLDVIEGGKVINEGSMLVWIPRYAYKITYYSDSRKTVCVGYSDSRGLVTEEGETPSSYPEPYLSVNVNGKINGVEYEFYRPHPAFENGTNTGFVQGEWDSKITGIWVGKFEVTGDISEITTLPYASKVVDNKISALYNGIKNKFKAKTTESHMIKNSEWGAIAYFTFSKYGRNGVEISKNGVNNKPKRSTDYKQQLDISTTGNIYGIFDLRGGKNDCVASYIANSDTTNGSSGYIFASNSGTIDSVNDKEISTKYATVYEYNTTTDLQNDNYELSINRKFGDAMVETSRRRKWQTNLEYNYRLLFKRFFCW